MECDEDEGIEQWMSESTHNTTQMGTAKRVRSVRFAKLESEGFMFGRVGAEQASN